jgi:transcriptional regulator with XRE-family HTH domain
MVSLSPINSDISELRLRVLRQQRGLSKADLAAQAGIALSTLYLVEDGFDVRVSTLKKVAQALGVSAGELFEPRGAS